MKYCIQSYDNGYDRKDFVKIHGLDIENTDFSKATEIYIGDSLWYVDNPRSFLTLLFYKLPIDCQLYIENIDLYIFATHITNGVLNATQVSDILYNGNYVRILDRDQSYNLLNETGFVVSQISSEKNNFVIVAKKEDK